MFDRDSGPMRIHTFPTLFVDVRPQFQCESTGKTAPRGREIVCNSRQIEWQIESDQKATAFVHGTIQLIDELTAGPPTQMFGLPLPVLRVSLNFVKLVI